MSKRIVISKALAEKLCKKEGIIFSDVLKEAQLLKSGAKLRFSRPRYVISGYAESGRDVDSTLSSLI